MDTDARLFRALLVSTSAMLFLDSIAWLFDGRTGGPSRDAIFIASALYYAVHTIPIAFFILYSDYQIFRDEKEIPKLAVPLSIIEVLVAIAAFLSLFTGSLFSVDEGNHYYRGPLFPVFAVVQFGLVAFILGNTSCSNRKMVNRRVFISLLAYPLPMGGRHTPDGVLRPHPHLADHDAFPRRSRVQHREPPLQDRLSDRNRESQEPRRGTRAEDRVQQTGKDASAVMIDIDDFKGINDRFGHEAETARSRTSRASCSLPSA